MFFDRIIQLMVIMIIGLGVAWSLDKKTEDTRSNKQAISLKWALNQ